MECVSRLRISALDFVGRGNWVPGVIKTDVESVGRFSVGTLVLAMGNGSKSICRC
jgi:hypothetical protein